MTTQEQLDQINTAIAAIETGAQEYTLGSRKVRRPDLTALYQERRMLRWQLAQENGGDTFVTVFDGR